MAKSQRQLVTLECSECRRRNYTTQKNFQKTKEKLVLSKYCKKCRKHTEHKEVK